MTASLDMIRGRSGVVPMTNNSGGALIAGDVCVQDVTADESVTTTTSAASTLKVFIAAESIGIGAVGKFYESIYCPFVNVNASVTRGHYLFTHTVAKQATGSATYAAGAFGRILKAGTTPSAIIYSATAQAGSAGADSTAIHVGTASEISAITEKTALTGNDLFVIEDSAAANVKKRVKWSNVAGPGLVATIAFIIDGGGSAITSGVKGDLIVDFGCTLNSWTILADASGAIKIDVWKDIFANFPPTDADSITNGHEPEIAASGTNAQDTSLGDWTSVTITAGDVLRFNVDSAATITRALLSFKATRT